MKNRKKINEAKIYYRQLILDESEQKPNLTFSKYCYQNNLQRIEDIRLGSLRASSLFPNNLIDNAINQ